MAPCLRRTQPGRGTTTSQAGQRLEQRRRCGVCRRGVGRGELVELAHRQRFHHWRNAVGRQTAATAACRHGWSRSMQAEARIPARTRADVAWRALR